jgi:hypothetical protein
MVRQTLSAAAYQRSGEVAARANPEPAQDATAG